MHCPPLFGTSTYPKRRNKNKNGGDKGSQFQHLNKCKLHTPSRCGTGHRVHQWGEGGGGEGVIFNSRAYSRPLGALCLKLRNATHITLAFKRNLADRLEGYPTGYGLTGAKALPGHRRPRCATAFRVRWCGRPTRVRYSRTVN